MPEPQRARNFARAERKFDLMQELQTDLLLICSNVSPASLGGIDRAAADFRALGERAAARGLRVGYRGAGLGTSRQRLSRRLGDRAPRRSQIDRDHSRQFPRAGAVVSDRPRSSRSRRTRSFWCSWPTRRSSASTCCPGAGISAASRARAICRWRAFMEAVPRPAMPARCRWRYSTISSAPAPRSAPRPTGCVRSSCWRISWRRAATGAPAARLQPKAQSRGVGFVEFAVRRSQSQRACRAVRPARLSQDRLPSQQGRRALVAGPYRTRDQLRTGRLRPFALCHARPRRLRHRDRRR